MQVVIALIVTPEGLPVAYEVMPGNTSDKSTLPEFLGKIESQYGKRNRLWIMDRGIPTEESLEQMRHEGASYLVGTPRGRLSRLENQLFAEPWKKVQDQVEVKLAHEGEDLYVLTRSGGRCDKERSMRRRKLKKLWRRLHEIRGMKSLKRDELLLKLGAAKRDAGVVWRLVELHLPEPRQPVTPASFHFSLNRIKLRKARRGEGSEAIIASAQPYPAGAATSPNRKPIKIMWGRPLTQTRQNLTVFAANGERWAKQSNSKDVGERSPTE